jgi:hypothetical protein
LLRVSLLAAFSIGVPERIFFTGTSSFLPFRVFGISGTATISFSTCLGEAFSLMLDLILPYIFPPTNTSTVARSSGFHVGSPVHTLVSPR